MAAESLLETIASFLRFVIPDAPVTYTTRETTEEDGYIRARIEYLGDEDDPIPAYLLLPRGDGPFPAVVVHHQHAGQRHLGKSEVCGLAGDPLQAFGPALAQRGFAVLAPDSICFEDRRRYHAGIEPDPADIDQHYNEMCYRLARGDTLMRKVLDDSARAMSLLRNHPRVDPGRIGMLGHSYGGNTVLFHAALDTRIAFACASGAAGSYRRRIADGTGLEMASVIPGFAARFDIEDLLACLSPRRALIVSATADPFSRDADAVVGRARALEPVSHIDHLRYAGGHALTGERFEAIMNWLSALGAPP